MRVLEAEAGFLTVQCRGASVYTQQGCSCALSMLECSAGVPGSAHAGDAHGAGLHRQGLQGD